MVTGRKWNVRGVMQSFGVRALWPYTLWKHPLDNAVTTRVLTAFLLSWHQEELLIFLHILPLQCNPPQKNHSKTKHLKLRTIHSVASQEFPFRNTSAAWTWLIQKALHSNVYLNRSDSQPYIQHTSTHHITKCHYYNHIQHYPMHSRADHYPRPHCTLCYILPLNPAILWIQSKQVKLSIVFIQHVHHLFVNYIKRQTQDILFNSCPPARASLHLTWPDSKLQFLLRHFITSEWQS